MNKELFEKYYDFKIDANKASIQVRKKGTNKWTELYRGSKPVYFRCGIDSTSEVELDKLYKEGKIIKTTHKEVMLSYTDITEEDYIFKITGCDSKTNQYLNKIKKELNFVKYDDGWKEEKFEPITQYSIWFNINEIEVGKLDNGLYVAQYCIQSNIDDYDIIKLYFSKMPSADDIRTITTVKDIEFHLLVHKDCFFNCRECGRKVHWLEIEGDITHKYQMLKEHCCCE